MVVVGKGIRAGNPEQSTVLSEPPTKAQKYPVRAEKKPDNWASNSFRMVRCSFCRLLNLFSSEIESIGSSAIDSALQISMTDSCYSEFSEYTCLNENS